LGVYNFHSDPVTFDVSVTQGETTVYEETISLRGVPEGEFAGSSEFVDLPNVVPTTVSGAIPERELTTSTTVSYDDLPIGFDFFFDLDDNGRVGISQWN